MLPRGPLPVVVVIDGLIVELGKAGDKNEGQSFFFCRLEGRVSERGSSKDVQLLASVLSV